MLLPLRCYDPYCFEGREPFLDHRIIEFCSKLDSKFKYRKGISKYTNGLFSKSVYKWVYRNTKVIILSKKLQYDIEAIVKLENIYYLSNGVNSFVLENRERNIEPVPHPIHIKNEESRFPDGNLPFQIFKHEGGDYRQTGKDMEGCPLTSSLRSRNGCREI